MLQDNLQRKSRNKTLTPQLPFERAAIVAVEKATLLPPQRAMTDDERHLLSRCFERDKASWDQFVERYAGLIYYTIKRTFALHSGSPAVDFADDLFQDIFLSLVKDDFFQLRRYRGDNGCTLASWLRMIGARRTIDHLRKLNKPANPLEESLPCGAANESEEEEKDDLFQLLAGATAKLQPREQIIIDLFFRQNLSAQAVASILGLSVGAVYTHKSRILAKLRETLEKSPCKKSRVPPTV